MKQAEKVSIGGYHFIIEREAYERLNGYIEDIRSTYRENNYADEIINDIEERIAELFIEKAGRNGIVDYRMVDTVILRIGSPAELATEEKAETAANPGTETPGDHDKPSNGEKTGASAGKDRPKRLYRNTDKRILGGVCSGIAAYFNTDTVLVRLAYIGIFLLIGIISGTGHNFAGGLATGLAISVPAYILLWIITPAAKTVEEKCRMTGEPIDLKQFQEKFENRMENVGMEMKTAPAFHAVGRVLSIISGIILMVTGVAFIAGCTMYDLIPDLIIKNTDIGRLGHYGTDEIILSQIILNPTSWLMLTGITALFSIWLIYNSILLIFNLKAPRWKPGTVIFILWIISLLASAIYLIRYLIIYGSLT